MARRSGSRRRNRAKGGLYPSDASAASLERGRARRDLDRPKDRPPPKQGSGRIASRRNREDGGWRSQCQCHFDRDWRRAQDPRSRTGSHTCFSLCACARCNISIDAANARACATIDARCDASVMHSPVCCALCAIQARVELSIDIDRIASGESVHATRIANSFDVREDGGGARAVAIEFNRRRPGESSMGRVVMFAVALRARPFRGEMAAPVVAPAPTNLSPGLLAAWPNALAWRRAARLSPAAGAIVRGRPSLSSV